MADDPPAGVPEWIVTYGDMMSLLLTFFIMLVSLSEVKGDSKYKAMIESIMRQLGYRSAPLSPPGEGFPLNATVEKLKSLGAHTDTDKGSGGVKKRGPEGDDLRVFRSRDGTSISVGGVLAFKPHEAEVSREVEDILRSVAQKLAGKPNKIDVRGHAAADALPAGSSFHDLFELSYERARAVGETLERSGIERERIRISAAADNEPLPASADKHSVQFDRVEVFVLDTYVKDFAGSRVQAP